jgi:hypothetical protein
MTETSLVAIFAGLMACLAVKIFILFKVKR